VIKKKQVQEALLICLKAEHRFTKMKVFYSPLYQGEKQP
jgi:hypothetical protein